MALVLVLSAQSKLVAEAQVSKFAECQIVK